MDLYFASQEFHCSLDLKSGFGIGNITRKRNNMNDDDEIMDHRFLNELNSKSIGDRLALLYKMFSSSLGDCNCEGGCGRMHIKDQDLLKMSMTMLGHMSENDGKLYPQNTEEGTG